MSINSDTPIVPNSFIHITFESESSLNFSMDSAGISAFQLLAMSNYFKLLGENALAHQLAQQRAQMEARRMQQGIITPDDVRRTIP